MIYADPSFFLSFYAFDANSEAAYDTYRHDRRRPLFFTQWQRFETRNAVRLAAHRLKRARQAVPFQIGQVLKEIEDDLREGILRHQELDWREAFRLAEELSETHTEASGCVSVDLWHVACAILIGADTFWTFDGEQHALAKAVQKFKVPTLRV